MRSSIFTTALLAAAPLVVPACHYSSCFVGSTWITLARGRKRLRDVREGDLVQSYDARAGRIEVRPVTRVFRHEPSPVGQLLSRSGAGPRGVTGNHPVFSALTGTFAPAAELAHGSATGKGLFWDERDLRTIELEPYRGGPHHHLAHVYNLSVAETETYFADGLLVHNKSDCDPTSPSCSPSAGGMGGDASDHPGAGGVAVASGGHAGNGGHAGSGAPYTGGEAGSAGSAGSAGAEP